MTIWDPRVPAPEWPEEVGYLVVFWDFRAKEWKVFGPPLRTLGEGLTHQAARKKADPRKVWRVVRVNRTYTNVSKPL